MTESGQPSDSGNSQIIDDPAGIADLLQRLLDGAVLIEARPRGSRMLLLTAVVDLDRQRGRFAIDSGRDAELNRAILASEALEISARLDTIPTRFTAGRFTATTGPDGVRFEAELPDRVVYLQKRRYFRAGVGTALDLRCRIAAENLALPGVALLDVRVLDIGIGGLALLCSEAEANALMAAPGPLPFRLRIDRRDGLAATLMARHSAVVTGARGAAARKVGCEFVALDATAEAGLQRLILTLERERIARDRQLR